VIAHDEQAARTTKQLETGLARLGDGVTQVKRDLHEFAGSVPKQIERAARMTKQLETGLAGLGDNVTQLKRDLHEFAGSVPKQIEQRLAAAMAECNLPDPLYAAFESMFRGPPDEIKRRLAVYLPSVREACAVTAAGVLDLGCGRGEWLDILAEHAIPARGIDINETVAAECRARGLDVAIGDALDAVRSQGSGSLAAITAFHIVEHLPYSSVVSLLIVIIETPNPENLVVGACNFYFDPTHRSPVPPPLLEFFVTQAGFEASTMRLHPSEVPSEFTVDDPFIRNWLFGPQDYAVIGRKRMQSS
jgi:SAM-dependent methyltransferase